MKEYIEHETKIIDYTIIRRRRKTIGISITQNHGVRVLAPTWVSIRELQDVMRKKAPWILEKLVLIEEIKKHKHTNRFVNGGTFSYLGRDYKLEVIKQYGIKSTNLDFNDVKFIVGVPAELTAEQQEESIREVLLEWYMEHAAETVTARIEIYAGRMGLKPFKVLIKNQKTRWGSCTKDNKIHINWKIIMAPMEIVDYLIVHELAHIKIKNHSVLFWNMVESVLPDYKKCRKWLRENGHMLGF